MTSYLIKSSKRKQKLYNKFLKNRTLDNQNKYKAYLKLFETIKKKSKKIIIYQNSTGTTTVFLEEVTVSLEEVTVFLEEVTVSLEEVTVFLEEVTVFLEKLIL